MARREEHHVYERRRRRTSLIFSLVVVLLMVGGIFAAMLYGPSSSERLSYGKYDIAQQALANGGSVYVLELNGNSVELQYLPSYVTYIDVDPGVSSLLASATQIAFVAPVNGTQEDLQLIDYARLQLALAFPNPSFGGMDGENVYGQPVVNCSVAAPQTPVVLFLAANGTPSISRDGSCVLVHGTGGGILAATDRLIYERIGIITGGQVIAG